MPDTIELLNEIADWECYDKGRRVPIIIAAMFNLTITDMELIRDGADVNTKPNGENPLDFAKSLNHSSIVKLLSTWVMFGLRTRLERLPRPNVRYQEIGRHHLSA